MPATTPKRWSESEIDGATDQAVADLFTAMFDLRPCAGSDGDDEPVMVDLSPDAKALVVLFVNEHGLTLDETSGSERAALAKLEGYAFRFALLFHCIRQATGEKVSDYVDGDDIDRGIRLVRWFGNETLRVYGELAGDDDDRETAELLKYIGRKGGTISERELQRNKRRYAASGAATAALQAMQDDGLGEWFYPPQKDTGGQPHRAFRLFVSNPADSADADSTGIPDSASGGIVGVGASARVRR